MDGYIMIVSYLNCTSNESPKYLLVRGNKNFVIFFSHNIDNCF